MRVKNLFKTYKLKGEYVEALKGVSFDLPDTGMVFVLGKSGCGKSTLLNVLSGLDNFDGGDIVFKGKSLKSFTPAELDDYRNTCCGFVFQEYNLIPELSVGDNIALALQLQGEKEVSDKVKNALNAVGLSGYETRKVTELSGGQKQRVAIARSIVKEPQIIFADEPSGALDSETGASIFELLKELSKDKLILIVSHDRESAEKYGDRIIELSDGEVISDTYQGYKESNSEDKFTPRHSKMPLKSALKIGCSSFKFHPVRMVATILLALFSFTFFGISIAISTFNKTTPLTKAISSSGAQYMTLKKYNVTKNYGASNLIEKFFGIACYYDAEEPFTADDVKKFSELAGDEALMLYLEHKSLYSISKEDKEALEGLDEHFSNAINGYMSITEAVIKKHGFVLYGSLPQKDNEVVINECLYNVYEEFGYIEDEVKIDVSSPSDLFGKEVDGLTITGVLDTGCDKKCYDNNHPLILKFIETKHGTSWMSVEPDHYPKYFSPETDYVFHEKLFVTQSRLFETFDDVYNYSYGSYSFLLCPIPTSKADLKRVVSYVAKLNNQGYNHDGQCFRFVSWVNSHRVDSEEDTELNELLIWYKEIMLLNIVYVNIAAYLGAIFFIFTFIFLLNYINASIRSQMKQIGIVCALGGDYKGIFKMYLLSSLILCGIVYVLSLGTTGILIAWLNATGWMQLPHYVSGISFKVMTLNVATIAIMLAISVITALIGTLTSLAKMRKLSPAEIIRKGQIK